MSRILGGFYLFCIIFEGRYLYQIVIIKEFFICTYFFIFYCHLFLGRPQYIQQKLLYIPLFVPIPEYIIKLILLTSVDVDVAMSLHLANS